MDESGKRPGRRSLLPTEIVTRRAATRTVVAAGLGLAAMAGPAEAQRGPTDRDEGPNRDPPGGGRLLSDVDPSDPPGRGRGAPRSGITDNDSGANADPPGTGRGMRQGITDTDEGPDADPAGNGRGHGLRAPTPFPGPRAR